MWYQDRTRVSVSKAGVFPSVLSLWHPALLFWTVWAPPHICQPCYHHPAVMEKRLHQGSCRAKTVMCSTLRQAWSVQVSVFLHRRWCDREQGRAVTTARASPVVTEKASRDISQTPWSHPSCPCGFLSRGPFSDLDTTTFHLLGSAIRGDPQATRPLPLWTR